MLNSDLIRGRRILEVGAYNVNGSCRNFVEGHFPARYVGTDIVTGPGVDMVVPVERLVAQFGHDYFDLVLCTATLEHIRDWRTAISQMKSVLRPGGWILLTMAAPGFPFHEYPSDYWRATTEQLLAVFHDYRHQQTDKGDGLISCICAQKSDQKPIPLDNIHLQAVGVHEKVACYADEVKVWVLRAGSRILGRPFRGITYLVNEIANRRADAPAPAPDPETPS